MFVVTVRISVGNPNLALGIRGGGFAHSFSVGALTEPLRREGVRNRNGGTAY